MGDLDDNLQNLHEHRKALEEEFRLASNDPLKLREVTRTSLTKLAPQAVETLESILVNGTDPMRYKAATFVIDHTIGKDGSDAEDSLEKLIASLTKTTSP